MKTTTKKMRPALKWHGGKAYLARRIIALFPPHKMYVEPFAGGLSVLLNKPSQGIVLEVAGDLDVALIEFYRILRDSPVALIDYLRKIPYTREMFEWASSGKGGADPIEAAARFMVRNRFSRGGLGCTFAWSERIRGGQPGDVNGWETILGKLPEIACRIADVGFHAKPAIDVMLAHDLPETLFYLDPPYLHETRTSRTVYAHEMSVEEHQRLLEAISRLQGMVVLSGYPSPLYDRLLAGWDRHEWDRPNDSGQGKTKERRVEHLWLNPACQRFRLPKW